MGRCEVVRMITDGNRRDQRYGGLLCRDTEGFGMVWPAETEI